MRAGRFRQGFPSYDGAGRVTATYLTDGGGDTAYGDALDVTGDTVLEQTEPAYDADGKVLSTLTRQRFHDATGTGPLGTPTTGVGARVSYSGSYYDAGGRLVATVDVGTNGGTAWARPGSVPARSDAVLVTGYTYDDAGRVFEVTDPRGLVNRTYYDALGRTTKTIEDYADGVVSDTDDKTAEYTYNAAGMTSLTAKLTGGGVQTTAWVYGVTTAASGIDSNDLVGATDWPDPTTGAASSSQAETTTVNALGQTVTSTDRNGTTHTLSYDVLGRVVSDAVTALGAGVGGAVRRVETAYDGQGNPYLVTSYDAASGGSIVNQVQRAYNGLGQLVTEYQEHGGAVNTSTSPKVQYTYSGMPSGADHSRLTGIVYPDGRTVGYDYGTGGLDDTISRLEALKDGSTVLEGYSYLGLGTVVVRSHPNPGVDLTYVKLSGEVDGDAGDEYTGLDRFGRVVDQRWVVSSTGTAVDRFQYSYDRDGNVLTRDNAVNASFDESYTYDSLNQIASFARGSHTQGWDYDAVGNFDSVTTDGGSPVTRSANAQNEITGISGATTPTYDANGNMTGDETGKGFVYDAWNRLVAVTSGSTTLETFGYDGLNRRVVEDSGTARDLYYSSGWQVLEERVGGVAQVQYVWSPVYVDALVERDRDTDANGTLDERLWVAQDANWNVTSIIDGSGVVQERYAEDPFGLVKLLDASWAEKTTGSDFGWLYSHQGGRYDPVSGLFYFRMRDYSATLGRFTSLDPIRFQGSDVDLYRDEGNAPLSHVDGMGLKWHVDAINPARCTIKLKMYITFFGPGATAQRAQKWAEDIEKTWSGKVRVSVKKYKCNCPTWTLTTSVVWQLGSGWLVSGYGNNIEIAVGGTGKERAEVRFGLFVDTGTWYTHTTDWSVGHEAGHLFGFADYYTGEGTPNPGYEKTIMGQYGGLAYWIATAPEAGGRSFLDMLADKAVVESDNSDSIENPFGPWSYY